MDSRVEILQTCVGIRAREEGKEGRREREGGRHGGAEGVSEGSRERWSRVCTDTHLRTSARAFLACLSFRILVLSSFALLVFPCILHSNPSQH